MDSFLSSYSHILLPLAAFSSQFFRPATCSVWCNFLSTLVSVSFTSCIDRLHYLWLGSGHPRTKCMKIKIILISSQVVLSVDQIQVILTKMSVPCSHSQKQLKLKEKSLGSPFLTVVDTGCVLGPQKGPLADFYSSPFVTSISSQHNVCVPIAAAFQEKQVETVSTFMIQSWKSKQHHFFHKYKIIQILGDVHRLHLAQEEYEGRL